MDACSLIAFFNDEEGANVVEDLLSRAEKKEIIIYINKINILEIYYGVLRDESLQKAEDVLERIIQFPLIVNDKLEDSIFKLAGMFKAKYKISLTQ
ncbi:PIN domain-containing protein [bacterium]|nr:PIN domain-containing protein [bacterium]